MKAKTSTLTPHPQNTYFFDDMTGEAWEKFLSSIEDHGIKDPILITQDNLVVSGHQRLRAAKELGLEEVPVIQETYSSEDEILRDLIELNIRQRGVMADSETKAGRRFKELRRIYGIKHGNNQHERTGQIVHSKLSEQLAEEMGTTQRQMNRTIQVADSDPRLQEWNINGKITGDTIRYMMSKLTPEERRDFYLNNEDVDKIRKNDVIRYQEEHNQSSAAKIPSDYDEVKEKLSALYKENELLQSQNFDLKNSLASKEDEIDYLLNEAGPTLENSILGQAESIEALRSEYDSKISDYQNKIDSMEVELSHLRAAQNPAVTEIGYGSTLYDFVSDNNKYIYRIAELKYSDAFRKIRADRTLPLNSLYESCEKVIDALQDLIKLIKTDTVIDVVEVID